MIVFAAMLVCMSENGQSETGLCVEPEKWWQKMILKECVIEQGINTPVKSVQEQLAIRPQLQDVEVVKLVVQQHLE